MSDSYLPFFSVRKAKRWLEAELPNSITTWEDLARNCFVYFLPSIKIAKLRSQILRLKQNDGENMYQVGSNLCPCFMISLTIIKIMTFWGMLSYKGHEPNTKNLLDSIGSEQETRRT